MTDPLLFRDDYEAFRRLPYFAQWDHLVAYAARTGNRAALPQILFHAFVFAAHIVGYGVLTRRTLPATLPAPAWHDAALKNTIVWTLLTNYLGLALSYVGPMYGEVGWRLTTRRFTTDIPIARGWLGRRCGLPARRQWFDVVHACALCAVCVVLLACGADVPPWAVAALAALALLAWFVLDVGAWVGTYGMQYHWPIAWLVQTYALPSFVALPCLQLWALAVYVGCAVAKCGPWWALGHANEWTMPPPFAGRRWWPVAVPRNTRLQRKRCVCTATCTAWIPHCR